MTRTVLGGVRGEDLYQDTEDIGGFSLDDSDVIDEAIAGEGYVSGYVVDDCYRTFNGLGGEDLRADPEVFDRFYYVPPVEGYAGPAPILVDIIRADAEGEQAAERERKRVEFKAQWCRENGYRYVVLTEATDLESGSVRTVLDRIAEQNPRTEAESLTENSTALPSEEPDEPKAKPAAKRSGVQRPRG